MVLGTAGFSLSIMNYLRDRPRIKVTLQWNMTNSKTGEVIGLVRVTNTGRRPIFISAVAIETTEQNTLLLLDESMQGTKLSEGDKPAAYFATHNGMEKYAAHWRKMRAYVEVSTGEKYWSDYPSKDTKPPKWAHPS